jgi:hypothetical protein
VITRAEALAISLVIYWKAVVDCDVFMRADNVRRVINLADERSSILANAG